MARSVFWGVAGAMALMLFTVCAEVVATPDISDRLVQFVQAIGLFCIAGALCKESH